MYSVLSVALINFALAMYPVLINTIAVAFVGRLLVQSFDWDGSYPQLKSYTRSFAISATHVILGIALYKLIITFAFPVQSNYNTETLPLSQMPERLRASLEQSFRQLYEYNMPFLSQWILWIFLGLTIMIVLYVCFTGNIKQKIARLFLLFASLFASQAAMIVSKTYLIADRIDLFGFVFFEVLVLMLVFSRLRKLHNISVPVGACIVFSSIINDLDCLRVWKLGFEGEKMYWNRVLARLEMQNAFDPAKQYDVIQVGKALSMRRCYYTGENKHALSPLLESSYNPNFSTFIGQSFFYPKRFCRRMLSTDCPGHRRDCAALLKILYEAGVLQKAEVWPRANSLIVWKDIILFVTDGKELENYKKQFAREPGR